MNMDLNVYAPMLLCLVPLVATFLLLAILLPGISVLREFLAVLAGLLAFVPIVILQFLFLGGRLELFMRTNLFLSIIHSLVFFGLIEEGMKAASLLILKARGESLKNFFAYSILAGMALGCFESVVYLLTALGTRPHISAEFLQLIFLRMATALVIHALCAGLGGLCIFYSKNIRRNFSPLVFAIVIHGIYDFFAAFAPPLNYFSVALILLAALECRIFYLRARENLASKKSVSSHSPDDSDSEKTIEIPKNPAVVISVKDEKKNSPAQMQIAQKEEPMFFRKNAEDGAEDFEKIQAEAEAAIKAEESKKSVSKKSAQTKNASEKTAVKHSAPGKAAEKTVVKKTTATKKAIEKKSAAVAATKKSAKKTSVKNPAKKSATKSISLKNNSAKRAPQISPTNSSAAKSKSVSEKKSILKNAAQTKKNSEKNAANNSASKKSAQAKKVSEKSTSRNSAPKKSAGKTSTKKTAATKKTASEKKSRL